MSDRSATKDGLTRALARAAGERRRNLKLAGIVIVAFMGAFAITRGADSAFTIAQLWPLFAFILIAALAIWALGPGDDRVA